MTARRLDDGGSEAVGTGEIREPGRVAAPGRSPASPRRLRPGAGALLAALAVAALGAPAAAQDVELIDNTGQTVGSVLRISAGDTNRPNARFATSFSTGNGATLKKVTVYVMGNNSSDVPRLRLRADSNGSPGSTVLHTFTGPSSVDGRQGGEDPDPGDAVYTSTGYTLAPSTTYWLEIDKHNRTAMWLGTTRRTSEDSGGQFGWSIGDTHVYLSGRHSSWTSGENPLRIKLEGAAAAASAPPAPTGLSATANGRTRIDLSWTAPVGNGGAAITGYKIEVSTDGGTDYDDLVADTNQTVTGFIHLGVPPGATRHYRVSAINSAGTSTASDAADATTEAAPVPEAPTALMASPIGPTRIDLSWAAPTDNGGAAITGYRIEVSTDGGTDYEDVVADTGGTNRTYSHTGLRGGTTYHYRVSAINSAGTGGASLPAHATTAAATAPGAPTGLMAEPNGPTQIDLRWTAPASDGGAAIAGYRIEVSTDGGNNYRNVVANTNNTATAYPHTGLAGDTAHRYRVSAINSVGEGDRATDDATTDAATIPHAPTGLMAEADGPTRILLRWTAPASDGGAAIAGYQIQVSSDGGNNFTNLVADTGSQATTHSHTGLAASSTRHYRVSAINSVGTSTGFSRANATTDGATAPGAPTALTAAAAGPDRIALSWSAPASDGGVPITGYRIVVSTDGNSFAPLVADTGGTGRTYRHDGLPGDTTRHYRVSAINSVGMGGASDSADATTAEATVPGKPTDLMATASGLTQIDLSWTAPARDGGAAIAGYRIEVSTDGISYGDLVPDTGSATPSHMHTGLTGSSTRHYRVSAINAVGTGLASASDDATTGAATAPGRPTGLTAMADGPTRIVLSWMVPDDNGSPITGYRIEVSTDGGGSYSPLEVNTGNTDPNHTHTGLPGDTTRHYRVSAINEIGTSIPSDHADATTAAATVPGKPTALKAMLNGPTQIDLSWMAPASDGGAAITGYRIEVSTDGGSIYRNVAANTGSPDTNYEDTGLARGSTRRYRVSAINSAGMGEASDFADAATLTATAPGAPTGIAAVTMGPTRIDLSWMAPANDGGAAITGYRIEVSTDGGNAFGDVEPNTGSQAMTYSHTGLAGGTAHRYRVSAINSVGTGPATHPANATTAAATVPGAPTELTATAERAARIDLSWTAPASDGGAAIAGYRIEVSTDGANFTELVADTGSQATAYPDTGLAGGSTRHYRVSAINSVGTSPASNVANATAIAAAIPHGPAKAWIARFGRTVGEQVLRAVDGRLRAARVAGAEARLAGEPIRSRPPSGAAPDEAAGPDGAELRRRSRAVTPRDLLTGSSFSLTAETASRDLVSVWGGGAISRFDGRAGGLALDGEVLTGMFGADWTRGSGAGSWTAGLIVSHGTGEGGWSGSGDEADGAFEAALTALFPWARVGLSDRLDAWGAAGAGKGELTAAPKTQGGGTGPGVRADLDFQMAAGGLRGTILEPRPVSGKGGLLDELTLTGLTDAMVARTSAGRGRGAGGASLRPVRATVSRLRLGVEASRPFGSRSGAGGAILTPSLELGARHDGGDAETGFGIDLGGGLALAAPGYGLLAELRGRGLIHHASKGFRERGLSAGLSWRQNRDTGRGPTLSLIRSVGGPSSGGAEALLSRATLDGAGAGGDPGRRRLELKLGYGFAALGDRFTLTPETGLALTGSGRDYSLRWRLAQRPRPGGTIGALALSSELRRRESGPGGNAPPEHAIRLKLTARW